ncbi:aminopeptidase P family protein [Aminobacter sp. AP02]|uniref:aminopeptidase P family protein n=1 Tax=Aminobacter sp. AP02 TaxID=2135737 RepID=UPI000D6C8EA7|nr:aminopeptidase P family protein [Aminobacter sp. AP02]PWK73977.1 Xaa-Pro aminopeptidase [Aminobacter sp. AP02]
MASTSEAGMRVERLRAWMRREGLHGMIVPRTDAHQSEDTAEYDNCLKYITGFTGSAGMALILEDSALIFVDGRYQVQVVDEVDLDLFEIRHLHEEPLPEWLRENARHDWRIGLNPMLVNVALFDRLDAAVAERGAVLIEQDQHAFDEIWIGRPERPVGPVRSMNVAIAGKSSIDKRKLVAADLQKAGATVLVETLPDNIAWLLNVRGSDVAMNPVPHSFLTLDADGRANWFVDRRKLGNRLSDFELDDTAISDPELFLGHLAARAPSARALVDLDFAPKSVHATIAGNGGAIIAATSPLTIAKARKNATELQGFRECHLEDGAALTNFLAWVSRELDTREKSGVPLTEMEAQERLLEFRAARRGFLEESFMTISAAGSNAAMCHYHSRPETNAAITRAAPYLVDSGGQYENGTTDVTRTLMFGVPTPRMKSAYTAVLKGFIALMSAKFPVGTFGHQLDALARLPLWEIELDYDHGTGHGVGHNLLIHEYPHRFAKKPNLYGLEPGNIMTIEPGYYEAGAFGMRVENQVEVVEAGSGFCRFETLTLAPIDLTMVNMADLTKRERSWIDDYHATVFDKLAGLVADQTMPMLTEWTRRREP